MSKGKRIKKTILDLIAREASTNPQVDRLLLAHELTHTIELMGEVSPSEETLIKMISSYRNKEPDDLEKPWTLAESVNHNFPPESTPALLRTKRYCMASGKSFCIRQAKWASYLYPLTNDVVNLEKWSGYYAGFETGYKARDIPLDTSDLDGTLIMSIPELSTASFLGRIVPIPVSDGGILSGPPIKSSYEDAIAAAAAVEEDVLNRFYKTVTDAKETSGFSTGEELLTPFKDLNLPEHQVWIYVHWLSALSKGPKWITINRTEVITNIMKLRSWITNDFPPLYEGTRSDWMNVIKKGIRLSLSHFVFRLELVPHELVDIAGFSPLSPTESPGNWAETIRRMENLGAGKRKMEAKRKKKTKTTEKEVKK